MYGSNIFRKKNKHEKNTRVKSCTEAVRADIAFPFSRRRHFAVGNSAEIHRRKIPRPYTFANFLSRTGNGSRAVWREKQFPSTNRRYFRSCKRVTRGWMGAGSGVGFDWKGGSRTSTGLQTIFFHTDESYRGISCSTDVLFFNGYDVFYWYTFAYYLQRKLYKSWTFFKPYLGT